MPQKSDQHSSDLIGQERFLPKRLKTEFSRGNKWCNTICNHTNHVLAQVAVKSNDKILRSGQKGQFLAKDGVLPKNRALSHFYTPGSLTCAKI